MKTLAKTTSLTLRCKPLRTALVAGLLLAWASTAMAAGNPFVGHWALTIPGGAAGWLGVEEKDGQLQGSLLWGGGSVLPVPSIKVDGDKLVIVRSQPARKAANKQNTETITATVAGDDMKLVLTTTKPDGKQAGRAEFTGKRTPPLPPRPELAKVKFGPALALFNGKDLSGWKPLNPAAPMGWSVENGVLINRTHQEKGKPHKSFANIRTEREFEDFNLTLEVRTLQGSNSGVYLRGIYEVQVLESYGKPLDPHNMGAIYSRICPTVAAEKPMGQWQTMDITLVDRHVTVILNGQKIIDNQPVPGCTGGALWSDPFRPGPIYLQGDHSDVDYRNIMLRPVVR